MSEEKVRAAGDESVRERLLDAAIDLFNRKGYAATTVREIVEAARVTKPVLYYYFGNKEGIYRALMHDAFSHIEELVAGADISSGTARERILQFCDNAFALFEQHLPVVRVMWAIYYGPPQGAPYFDFEAFHRSFEETLVRIVGEGMASGEFRSGDVGDVTLALLGALNVAMEMTLCHPERAIGREGLARTLDLVFAGIAAPVPAQKEQTQ